MRLGSVLSEAWRNLTSGTTRALWFAVVLAVVGGLFGYLETTSANRIDEEAARFRSAGASTFVLVAPGAIRGEACDALANTADIRRAGALRDSQTAVRHRALPNSPVAYKEVTPGFSRLLALTDRSADPAGVLVSAAVAETFGVRSGSEFEADTGTVRVAGVYDYPDDGRSPELGFAAVGMTPSAATFDECWAEIWPPDRSTAQRLRNALTVAAQPEAQPELRQLNGSLGTQLDVRDLFDRRLTRHGSVTVLLVGLALGWFSVWMRRLEIASALHCGVPRASQVVQVALETIVWTSAGVLLALPIALYQAKVAVAPTPVLVLGLRCLAGAWAGAVIGAAIAAAQVREHKLFRFFKYQA